MLAAGLWMLAAALLYGPVLVKLAHDWRIDPTYSHGFVVPPIALYLVWRQRERLRSAVPRPSAAGLAILVFSLAVFAAGWLGAELFLTRISMIGVIAGSVVYVFGWRHLQLVSFPVAFLVFMIPLPAVVFNEIAVRLQIIASQTGEHLLRAADVPVLRDGNMLTLANGKLEVNDACSGIRSLVALLSIAALTGHVLGLGSARRLLIGAAAVPLAIALNGVRIAATGVAVAQFGSEVARGALHTASGMVVFAVALACVLALHRPARMEPV
jgi:exosortase